MRLTCPPLAPADLQGAPGSVDVRAMREIGARYAAPASTFGLELKAAYALEAAGHGGEELRRPYYRLAQEPFIWSYWVSLQQCPLAAAEMLALASLLNGKPVAWRVREMVSLRGAGGEHVHYEMPERSATWLADIAMADPSARSLSKAPLALRHAAPDAPLRGQHRLQSPAATVDPRL